MISRTLAQKATRLLEEEWNKITSPHCYGTDLVAGDIKRVSTSLLYDLHNIEKEHGQHISSKVRGYLIEELHDHLENLKESRPGLYLKMLPRIHSVETDLREEQEDYALI